MITLIKLTTSQKEEEETRATQHLSLSLYSSKTTTDTHEEDIHCEHNEVSDTHAHALFKRDNGASSSDRLERMRDSCCTNQHLAVLNHSPRNRHRSETERFALVAHLTNSRRAERGKRWTSHRVAWVTHGVGVDRLIRSCRGCWIEISHHCMAGREVLLQLLFLFPIFGPSILEPDLRERQTSRCIPSITLSMHERCPTRLLDCTYWLEISSQTREQRGCVSRS